MIWVIVMIETKNVINKYKKTKDVHYIVGGLLSAAAIVISNYKIDVEQVKRVLREINPESRRGEKIDGWKQLERLIAECGSDT